MVHRTYARPEVLAPAGSLEKLRTAITYGADAVYLSGPGPNLRVKGGDFSPEELLGAISLARDKGVRVYCCLNAFPRETELGDAADALRLLADFGKHGPDALIIADPGVLRLAQRFTPELEIHLSTQANTANSESMAFWRDCGVSRVNLARELDLKGIRAMAEAAQKAGGPELEVFVHGAMCMAVSGRCLLSAYVNQRSANLGACTHPCRFRYKPASLGLEEALRPGEALWELEECGTHSSLLAAEDLCLIRYISWFRRLGIQALKIEGRTKSELYVAQAVDAYKSALLDLEQGHFRPQAYLSELENAATRKLGSGFFLPAGRRTVWSPEKKRLPLLGKVLGKVEGTEHDWHVAVKSPWEASQDISLLLPGLRRPYLAANEYRLEDPEGGGLAKTHPGLNAVFSCAHPGMQAGIFIRTAPD